MKNLKFIIVAVMLLAQTATYALGLDMGVEAAISKANFKMKGDKSAIDNDLGYGIGVSAKANIALFSVGPELWYTRNTMTIVDESYFGDTANIKCNSIDVPVVVSYSILGPLKIEAGPSFLLYSSAKADYGDQTYNIGRVKPEVGYVVGARVTILSKLTVAARFNGCFSTSNVDLMGEMYKMRYNSCTLSAGVIF